MKRIFILLGIFALLFTGCNEQRPEIPGTFYYPRTEYVQAGNNQVLAPETREIAGYTEPAALLELYLKGPQSSLLRNPFPAGCHLISWSLEGSEMSIIVSDEFAQLTGINLIVACAGLTQTCIEHFSVESLRIQADTLLLDGDKFILMTAENLLFTDIATSQAPSN